MSNIQKIVNQQISQYHTTNIRELLEFHDIEIFYYDSSTKNDSSIFVHNELGNIYLKSQLNPLYENFLLAHELGHYLLHFHQNINFSFTLSCYKNRLEREANEFACRFLLSDISIDNDSDIEFIIKEKGIPLTIWYSLYEKIIPDLIKKES